MKVINEVFWLQDNMIIGIEADHANKTERTGVEEYAWRAIQELKRSLPSDVRVVLYCQKPLQGELAVLPPNWSVKILSWPFKKMWSQIRLSWEFLWRAPDVYFAPGQLIPIICPKNTVVTLHDSAFLVFPRAYNFLGRQYLKWMNKMLIKKAKKILTPSQFSLEETKKFYGAQVGKKMLVTPLAYDSEKYNLGKISLAMIEESKKKYRISKPYLINVNRLEEKKNTKGLVQAFNKIKADGQDVQLVLVGRPGVGYQEIELEIENSPYLQDIILPGWVENDEVPNLVAGAEVFAVPSLYEGFGLPVLQAMAVGCPVVAGAGSSMEEVGGGAALYADPKNLEAIADNIKKILMDKNLKNQLKNAGLERTKNYSWQKTGQLTAEAILSCQKG